MDDGSRLYKEGDARIETGGSPIVEGNNFKNLSLPSLS